MLEVETATELIYDVLGRVVKEHPIALPDAGGE